MSDKKTRYDKILEGMAVWGSYYRENIDVFVKEYLNITYLKWYQYAVLCLMNANVIFLWIASRGMGKTFITAIFSCVRCILYPGSKVVLTSGTRGQALQILEKIQVELIQRSPNLKNEIDFKETKFSGQDAKVMFKNGSYIKVVTASDTARGNRANLLVVDEFRLVKQDTISTVLKKFLTERREPPYSELTKEEVKLERAKEPNMQFYLSSAYFKDHWSYAQMLSNFRTMLNGGRATFVCGLPYELAIQEGRMFREDIESDMLEADFNELKFKMEMEAMWIGGEAGAFFDFDSISKNRRIQYPMLPDSMAVKLGNSQKVKIPPKVNGEKRILSADIALMSSKKHNNDASAIFINQMLPTKSGRYTSNIVYGDCFEGMHTEDQALVIRKLYDEFSCDYIVLDCTGLGLGVYDALVRDMVDPDSGEIYPALSCCNNQEMAERCTTKGADKVIWAIKGSPSLNSDCAVLLREGFRSSKIRLLVTEYDAESLFGGIKGYNSLTPLEKTRMLMPYVHTTLLIDELVKLQHEESGGRVRIYERAGMRKDRYSSLSYNYYVALQIENKMSRNKAADFNSKDIFMFKAPKLK